MLLGGIVAFSKVLRQILSAHEDYARQSKAEKNTARFSSISEYCPEWFFILEMLISSSRRDGSSFMNLLMIAPLCDSRGKIRYHIGAQVDVSGLVKDCTDLESLQRLVVQDQNQEHSNNVSATTKHNAIQDEFQELSEMLNMGELDTVRKWGGRMHREYQDDEANDTRSNASHMPRLLLKEPTMSVNQTSSISDRSNGKLSGIYQHVRNSITAATATDQ